MFSLQPIRNPVIHIHYSFLPGFALAARRFSVCVLIVITVLLITMDAFSSRFGNIAR